jgi:hypothetical protein
MRDECSVIDDTNWDCVCVLLNKINAVHNLLMCYYDIQFYFEINLIKFWNLLYRPLLSSAIAKIDKYK